MIKLLKKGSAIIGVDGAIAYTILSRIIQAGGGVVTLLFVARSLSKIEQGYYYTFGSILAIQIFFELGLTNIITQFVAHETARIEWNDKVSFTGSEEAASRLSSLLRFTLKWFVVIAFLLFIGLYIAGNYFFGKFGNENVNDGAAVLVEWQKPWVILSFITVLSLILSPILAFLEGLGRVKDVAKIRLIQQIAQLLLVLVFFSVGFKLFSTPVAAVISTFLVIGWVLFSDIRRLLFFIWNKKGEYNVNYKLEIFPFQWKIALSWISGYFIFQLFNPVLFAEEGAVVAGQMGMTLAVLNAILMFSLSWINTKIPVLSNLIARKEYTQLDSLFNKSLFQSTMINLFATSMFFVVIFLLRYFDIKFNGKNFADRFLPLTAMLFMIITIVLNHVIAAWATYLRSHKQEPMMIQSVVIGFLCCVSTIVLGKKFGLYGMTLGYMVITIFSFIWTYIIFKTKKSAWHE